MKVTSHPLIITDPAQLGGLRVAMFMGPRRPGRLVLQTEAMTDVQRQAWERRLNRHLFACGCDIGAFGLVLGLTAALVWIPVDASALGHVRLSHLWVALISGIVAAVVGKLIGLARAQSRFNKLVHEISMDWPSVPVAATETRCG